ncbi:hypothetical protein KR054_012106 [Drosophila jambulina]|nr:hypothetical protein KR054_012106 [Drosophila jambulina]
MTNNRNVLVIGKARASCVISKDTLATNHVFLSYENNAWDLLHSDTVPVSHSIYLLCGGGKRPKKFDCDVHGTFSPALPTTNCATALRATVKEDINDPTCNKPPLGMFIVGYQYDGQLLEIYRSCYDKTGYAAQFSIHKVYRSFDGEVKEAAAFKNDNIFNCFEADLGNGQTYMAQGSCLFNRGHLTAVADFPFEQLQRATYKLRNVVPQYAAVNNGNWKAVESWVRRLFDRKNYDVLKVCTGALEVQQLQNQQTNKMTPLYLLDNKIPVPKWTYKIVSHLSGAKYVVLTYNDIYATREPDPRPICRIKGCDADLKKGGIGFTFCCWPDDFIRNNLVQLTGVC